jgi:hypothetical protein
MRSRTFRARWRIGASVLSIAGGVLVAGRAGAAELSVRGPHECPDTAELTFRVERLLGMSLSRAAVLHFDVEFAVAHAGYGARLVVGRGGSATDPKQRDLHAPTCGELGDALSVAIALALGANASDSQNALPEEAPAQASSEPVPAPEAVASQGSQPDVAQAAAEQVPAERSSFSPALLLAAVYDTGSLPAPGFGAAFGVELRADRFALRALGELAFEQHAGLPGSGTTTIGADMSLALGSLEACAAPFGSLRGSLAVSLCAGWELGRLSGTGTGVTQPRDGGQLWSAPRVGVGLGWTIPGTALRLETLLTLAAPLERQDFVLRDMGRIYRPPSLVGRWAVGVDVSFD